MKKTDLRNRQRSPEENKLIGSRIKHYRNNLRLTQKELGEEIRRSAIAIRKYEKGDIEVPLDVLKSICSVLKVSLFELMSKESLSTVSDDFLLSTAKENNISVSDLINTGRTMYIDEVDRGIALDLKLQAIEGESKSIKIYQRATTDIERIASKYPHDSDTVLNIFSRVEYLISGLYLKKGDSNLNITSENIALLDELTSKLVELTERDIVLNPNENPDRYNELSLQTIQEINSLLFKLLKNKISIYSNSKDSDN